MTSLTLVIAMQATMLAAGAETYAEAHRQTCETGRPLVVMVGADWCPACQQMKQDVIPQVRKRGILRRVAFAVVNLDRERDLARELTHGGPVPQLLMFRRTALGWRLRRLVGGQNVQTVENFIHEGLAADEQAKQAAQPQPKPESPGAGAAAQSGAPSPASAPPPKAPPAANQASVEK